MVRAILWGSAALALLVGGVWGYGLMAGGGDQPACCASAASTSFDPSRPDCPGQVVCPLTGELVCRDRCPLATKASGERADVPSCCRNRQL